MRLIDPGPASIASVENDFEYPSGFLPLVLGEREGIVKLFKDELHDAFDLALLLRGKMIKVRLHRSNPSKLFGRLHVPSAAARGDGAIHSAEEPRAERSTLATIR